MAQCRVGNSPIVDKGFPTPVGIYVILERIVTMWLNRYRPDPKDSRLRAVILNAKILLIEFLWRFPCLHIEGYVGGQREEDELRKAFPPSTGAQFLSMDPFRVAGNRPHGTVSLLIIDEMMGVNLSIAHRAVIWERAYDMLTPNGLVIIIQTTQGLTDEERRCDLEGISRFGKVEEVWFDGSVRIIAAQNPKK